MTNASMTNPARDTGSYNACVWRIQGGKPISVQAARFVDGRILRTAGTWNHDNGLPAYHAGFVAAHETFAGEPCTIVVTAGVEGMVEAMRMSFAKAYARASKRTLGVFGFVNMPGLVQMDAVEGTVAR